MGWRGAQGAGGRGLATGSQAGEAWGLSAGKGLALASLCGTVPTPGAPAGFFCQYHLGAKFQAAPWLGAQVPLQAHLLSPH